MKRPALAVLLLALAAAGCRDAGRDRTHYVSEAGTVALRRSASSSADSSRRTALVDAVQRVAPAVVSISATTRQVSQPSPWDFFFVPREQLVQSSGTGFVIRRNGIILTNTHVVADAEKVIVTLSDGTDLPARVLGADPITDIAVLKVDRTALPTVVIGRSTDLMIGEWVVALGNPFAYLLGNTEPTVTAGVVSATGRNILPQGNQTGLYLDMIQTDAAINPGNSGGPLVNALGEVIGVNSSIFSNTGGSIGLGFAIPIERAVRVAEEITRTGVVRRAWVGLDVAGAGNMSDWKTQGGVVVTSVAPGGPAAAAGLQTNDVLMDAGGRRLRNFLDWESVKLDLHVGDSLRVRFRRGDRTLDRIIVPGDLPTVTAEKVNVLKGLDLVTVTPAIRAERGLHTEQGALIFRISPQIAQATGLQEGDVIIGLNRTPIQQAEQVDRFFRDARGGQPIRVHIERQGHYAYTDLLFQ